MSLVMAIFMSKSAQTRILLSCSDIPVIPGMDIARSSFDKWIHATSCILQKQWTCKVEDMTAMRSSSYYSLIHTSSLVQFYA